MAAAHPQTIEQPEFIPKDSPPRSEETPRESSGGNVFLAKRGREKPESARCPSFMHLVSGLPSQLQRFGSIPLLPSQSVTVAASGATDRQPETRRNEKRSLRSSARRIKRSSRVLKALSRTRYAAPFGRVSSARHINIIIIRHKDYDQHSWLRDLNRQFHVRISGVSTATTTSVRDWDYSRILKSCF